MNSKYIEDLDYLVNSLKSIHPDLFRNCSGEEFNNKVNEIKNMELDDNSFNLEVMKLLSLVGDPHTEIDLDSKAVFKYKFIDNKLYILDDYVNFDSKYINKEITSINNIPIDEVVNLMNNYISYDNESCREKNLIELLNNETFMKNILNSDTLVFNCRDEQKNINFDYSKEVEKQYVKYDSKLLRTDLGNNTMYIKYGTCNEKLENNLREFVANTVVEINEKKPESVIVDLRGNNGGSSAFFKPLKEVLSSIKNKVTLVDEKTFSSGVIAMADMKQIGSKVVGEEVALTQNHFGDCKSIILPNTGLNVWCSTAEFVYFNDKLVKITEEEKMEDGNVKIKVYDEEKIVSQSLLSTRENFELEEEIKPSIEDYKKYGDPVLYKVKNEMSNIMSDNMYRDLEVNLNNKAREFLPIIYTEYSKYMNKEQMDMLKQLINSEKIVVVEENDKTYQLQNGEKMKGLAHGGRVFEDNKIHFYPFNLIDKSNLKEKTEGLLMHELFHFFVRPEFRDENNNVVAAVGEFEQIRHDTSEALVDMCARDVNMKYGINQGYSSNYANNVIFFREALNNIENKDERMNLVFNGNVSDIFNKTTKEGYNTYNEYYNNKYMNTEFHQIINDYATNNALGKEEGAKRSMLNIAANCESKEKALVTIDNRWKNLLGGQVKTQEKNAVKKLVPQQQNENNNNTSSNGFVSTLVLSLLTGFAMGIVATLAYIFINK